MLLEFKSIKDLRTKLPNEEACIDYFAMVRWNGRTVCPYCNHEHCYDIANKKFKCSSCKKIFTVKVGTIFEGSKVSLQDWFMAYFLISTTAKGISSVQLAKMLGVTQKTAWFMGHRIREATMENNVKFDNIVEIDETYVGGKEGNKHESKKLKIGATTGGKIPVLGMVERNGLVQTFVISDTKMQTLENLIHKHIKDSAIIMTDEHKGYANLNMAYEHRYVIHSQKQYVNEKLNNGVKTHTNTIEGFWSLVKRSIIGIYHYVSPKHLHRYMNDLTFKYNSKDDDLTCILHGLLWNSLEKRLTYKELIA